MQTVVNKVHTLFSRFLQTPKYHTKHFLKFSVFVTFSFHDMTLRNILKTSEDQVIKPSVVIRFDVVYPRVSLKTLKSKSAIFYIIISKKYTILKSLQGLQEHHGHTHN